MGLYTELFYAIILVVFLLFAVLLSLHLLMFFYTCIVSIAHKTTHKLWDYEIRVNELCKSSPQLRVNFMHWCNLTVVTDFITTCKNNYHGHDNF